MSDIVQRIRDLQLTNRSEAECLLLSFLRDQHGLDAASVRLTPKPTSLNSFNGFLTLSDGKELFFKTHTESHTLIQEYYNAEILAQAGYPIIQPIYRATQPGQQILLYEVVTDPCVFDLAWDIENGLRVLDTELSSAQDVEDKVLFERYFRTLEWSDASVHASAPIHQLFWHRLVGGRLDSFYSGNIELPQIGSLPMSDVLQWRWQINGQEYVVTLADIIQHAIQLLDPNRDGPSIIGHGDAHNGNVFLQRQAVGASLVYFDPAFAGRHDPLLDLVKPLFHNVFAMWMYYPEEKRQSANVHGRLQSGAMIVEYDYDLPDIRRMFFSSKINNVLLPLLKQLLRQGWLRSDWRQYLKAALFCCPFLTMNLSDRTRFSPEIALLGLAMSVEMGAESGNQRSLLDATLDQVEMLL